MVGALDDALDVGDKGIGPVERFQVAGLAWAHDDHPMRGNYRGGEAGQPIRDQMRLGVERRLGPSRHRRAREIVDGVEAHMLRMPVVVEIDGSHERRLVLRAAPGLVAVNTAQNRVVGNDHALEEPPRFTLGHGFEQLVLDPPGGAVADAEVTHERQHPVMLFLILGHRVDRLEPLGQRQLGGMEE